TSPPGTSPSTSTAATARPSSDYRGLLTCERIRSWAHDSLSNPTTAHARPAPRDDPSSLACSGVRCGRCQGAAHFIGPPGLLFPSGVPPRSSLGDRPVIGGSGTFCFDVTTALGFGFSLTFCDMTLSLVDVETLTSIRVAGPAPAGPPLAIHRND